MATMKPFRIITRGFAAYFSNGELYVRGWSIEGGTWEDFLNAVHAVARTQPRISREAV